MRTNILTPDPTDIANSGRWPGLLEALRGRLSGAGFDVSHCPWTDHHGIDRDALVLPLLAWGYHRAPDRWLERVDAWQKAGVRILNPPSVLRWNMSKAYLDRLRQNGAPVPPSLYVDRVSIPVLEWALREFGVAAVVAKPLISATAYRTLKWRSGQSLTEGPLGPAIIQPFLESVERSGEISLIFFDGAFSHAVRKQPAPGDFRVQPEWNGIITASKPTREELRVSEGILRLVAEKLLYARVDLIRDHRDVPVLIELELIEPDLYLTFAPDDGLKFITAIQRQFHQIWE